jgi:phosphoserine phosphatase RsbU/P
LASLQSETGTHFCFSFFMSDQPPASLPLATPNEPLEPAILRLLMEAIPDFIYFKDCTSRFVRVNRALARLVGVESPDELIGKSDIDFFAPALAYAAMAEEQAILRTGQPLLSKVERITKRDGTEIWGSTSKLPWHDATGRLIGTFGLTRDITAAKQAEDLLVDERNLLQTIIDHLPSRVFVKDREGRYLVNNKAHLKLLGVQSQDEVTGRTVFDFYPNELGRQASTDDQQVFSGGPSIFNREEAEYGPEGLTRCSLTTKVPLRDSQGNISGLLGIMHDITKRKQTEQELQQRTDEMETDLRMARQIQESFFPRVYPVFPRGVAPAASALRFAHRYVAAATLGGDFFDIVPLSDTQCAVLVCDVMGHGVRAGLLTALIRGVVKEIGAAEPAHVLSEINHSLIPILERTGQPLFATVFFGVFDTSAGSLIFANAGHPPPLLVRSTLGQVEQLALANPEPAAGLVADFVYSQRTEKIDFGDVFLGYTDGLIEACTPAGEIFGEERLREAIVRHTAQPVATLIERLLTEVQTFVGRPEFEDDVCVVAVESTGTTCPVQPRSYQI